VPPTAIGVSSPGGRVLKKAREGRDHWRSLLNQVLVQAFDRKDPAAAQRAFDELKKQYPEVPNLDRIQTQISGLRAEG
jgi:hypothetical protein